MKARKSAVVLALIITMLASMLPCVSADAQIGIGIMNFDYDENTLVEAMGSAKVTLDDKNSHSGDKSVKVSSVKSANDGAMLKMGAGSEELKYSASLWVMSDKAAKITAELNGIKINAANLQAGKWTRIGGTVIFDKVPEDLTLSVYCINNAADFYIDDISVLPEGEFNTTPFMPEGMNMLKNADLEEGVAEPFEGRSASVEATTAAAKDGKYGLAVTGRTESWNGMQVSIKDFLAYQCQYAVEFDFKNVADADSTNSYNLSLEYADQTSGGTIYTGIQSFTAPGDEWIHVKGTFVTHTYSMPLEKMYAYVESGDGSLNDYYIDNFSVSYYVPANIEQKVPLEDMPSLKEVYKDYFKVGAAWDQWENYSGREDYFLKMYNAFTIGNAMKPDATQPRKGDFNFKIPDEGVEYATEHDIELHGHVFVWHEQTPEWFTNVSSREEALDNMRTQINTLAERYGDKVTTWDVVNEAINDITDKNSISGILRDAPWKRVVGEDYILQAFKIAGEALPNTKLYYNDYNLDDGNKADAVCTLVKYLRENGARIDGVGMQGHYNVNTSAKAVEETIGKLEALGVDIHISELDVSFTPMHGEPTEEEYIRQAQKYAELFQVFKRHKDAIKKVTFWGTNDGGSWRAANYPLILDANYDPKPAFYAVVDPDKYLEENPPMPKVYRTANAIKGTPTIDGEKDAIWNDAPEFSINNYIMAWQGASAKCKALWDENNLYIYAEVTDGVLSDKANDAYNQDSVEIFIDENNKKTPYFEDHGDAHYRVNYKNVQSYGTGGISDGSFKTAAKEVTGGYVVEAAIPFQTIKGENGTVIGFDAQVNDDGKGTGDRNSIAKFNDMTDMSWGNTENYGNMGLYNTAADIPDEPVQAVPTTNNDKIKIIIDGKELKTDVAPIIKNDRTLVPFRALLQALDSEVGWDDSTKTVTSSKDGMTIELQIGSVTALVNGEEKTLDTAPEIVEDRTLIPLRFVSENLKYKVDWDGEARVITISTK